MATSCESVNTNRKSPPQINPFRLFVTEELVRRKKISNGSATPAVSPYARLTSCLQSEEQGYKFLSFGLHGFIPQQGLNIFDLSYGTGNETVGYAVNLGKNSPTVVSNYEYKLINTSQISAGDYNALLKAGAIAPNSARALTEIAGRTLQEFDPKKTPALGSHPIPGITQLSVERFAIAAGTRATVTGKCYNRQQLEFLRHHFLSVGTYVLEWGNEFTNTANIQNNNRIDFRTIGGYRKRDSYIQNHDPKRVRKLLLHKREINKIIGKVKQKGYTMIPLSLYFKEGRIKVELALVRGKTTIDEREDIKKRTVEREIQRAMR